MKFLKKQELRQTDLDAVAVSKGPGSYTGLRIGVSVAKGIAYAASIPLIAVDTTLSMFYGAYKKIAQERILFCLSHARCQKNGGLLCNLQE